MQHKPKKRFGQNFLEDQSFINNILTAFDPKPADKVIEIGGGLGALTKPLLKIVNNLQVIEIDFDLQSYLKSIASNLKIIGADALSVDYSHFGTDSRIIGNLPYNISTPLILHLLNYKDYIRDMHFMLQKEVAERITANPGSKDYGRLSVITQYFCAAQHLFDVPATAFNPAPKVESAFIRLTPYKESPYPIIDSKVLERLVQQSFAMRRKTIANNLKTVLSREDLLELGIDPNFRPEQIPVNSYVHMAKFLSK